MEDTTIFKQQHKGWVGICKAVMVTPQLGKVPEFAEYFLPAAELVLLSLSLCNLVFSNNLEELISTDVPFLCINL